MYLQKKIEALTAFGLVSRHINRHLKISLLLLYKNTKKSRDMSFFICYDSEMHADSKNVICIALACSIVEIL